MTFCGYNDTMASGLRLFVEGMIEAMTTRHEQGVPMPQVVASELVDLRRMNQVLEARDPRMTPVLLDGLMAINVFAQTIFTLAQPESESPVRFSDACRRYGEDFIRLVKQTEDRHQMELEKYGALAGDIRSIEAVARWLIERHSGEAIPQQLAMTDG